MFHAAAHHPIISLFSSTGSDPLSLFLTEIDPTTPGQSCICLLHDAKSEPRPAPPATLLLSTPSGLLEPQGVTQGSSPSSAGRAVSTLSDSQGYTLDQTVLHIQSPDLRRTFIQCPPIREDDGGPKRSSSRTGIASGIPGSVNAATITTFGTTVGGSRSLGIRHPWIHLQVRNLGKDWSFEVGLVDSSNRMGILRLSTFQTEPRIRLSDAKLPILHLPLTFPDASSRPLTSWTTINLHLPTYLPHFSSSLLTTTNKADQSSSSSTHPLSSYSVPQGPYSHVSYVRVYATCRLRRIWFSETNPNNASGQQLPWEFELYACD